MSKVFTQYICCSELFHDRPQCSKAGKQAQKKDILHWICVVSTDPFIVVVAAAAFQNPQAASSIYHSLVVERFE